MSQDPTKSQKDAVWRRDEPASPCVQICVIHPEARLCTGCLRSIEEITGWSRMSNEERLAIMATLDERKPLIAKRRGGRAAKHNRRNNAPD